MNSHRVLIIAFFLVAGCAAPRPEMADPDIVISVINTNDVHGELLPSEGRGGLATISGYANALRAAHAENDDEVLLIDAGDMWQGTLESNLGEGAAMVQAYNAMGYAAAAIGNHEFDFGPVGPDATPVNEQQDARGNLKKRATEARFPLLASNLIDESTDQLVDWDNVAPSVMLDVQGIKVGIVGAITKDALRTTIAANTRGLRLAPLAETISVEARKLREQGATLVIVTAHAGSICTNFDNPRDLSSCDMDGEIIQVARAIPAGLVDQVIGGHVHEKIAHFVDGIAVTSAKSSTRAFGRVDYTLDRHTGAVIDRKIHPPAAPCPWIVEDSGACTWSADAEGVVPARYEGRPVVPQPEVVAIGKEALARASELKEQKLGVFLETAITLEGNPESALGNLYTDALLASVDGDIAIHNVTGGIRADLPAGDLTFGSVYAMSPFDNRIVVIDMSGRQLRRIIEKQAHNHGRRAGFSGMRVDVSCNDEHMHIDMIRADGHVIEDDDRVHVIANDYLTMGGDDILTPKMTGAGYRYDDAHPFTRDAIVNWLRLRGGSLSADQFVHENQRKWNLPDNLPASCRL
jgi:5'-nucleotidase